MTAEACTRRSLFACGALADVGRTGSDSERQPQAPSGVVESTIEAPELASAESGSGEQVDVRPAEPPSSEAVLVEEMQRFVVRGDEPAWEAPQEIERRRALAKRAARQLAGDGRVGHHPTVFQQACKLRHAMTEVRDPH